MKELNANQQLINGHCVQTCIYNYFNLNRDYTLLSPEDEQKTGFNSIEEHKLWLNFGLFKYDIEQALFEPLEEEAVERRINLLMEGKFNCVLRVDVELSEDQIHAVMIYFKDGKAYLSDPLVLELIKIKTPLDFIERYLSIVAISIIIKQQDKFEPVLPLWIIDNRKL